VRCDVLIIGAGPAGLATALTTSERGLETIVVEKNREIGYPIKTSAFSWNELAEKWIRNESSICQRQNRIYVNHITSRKDVTVNFGKTIAFTLNYDEFLQELANRCAEAGVRFWLDSNFLKPLVEGDYIVGGVVNHEGQEKITVISKVVVDCSGPNSVILRFLNSDYKEKEIGFGIEYEMANVNDLDEKMAYFFVGREVVPIGYGWVFPTGKKRARIGVCSVYNTKEEVDGRILDYFYNFFSDKSPISGMVRNATPISKHSGAYALAGIVDKPYGNGYLVVGDAASQASPLLGEGIRYALEFGEYAGKTICEASKQNNFSSKFLSRYKEMCDSYLGERFRVAADLLQIPTEEYWEGIVDMITKLKKEDKMDQILSYFKTDLNYSEARKMMPNFIKYLCR